MSCRHLGLQICVRSLVTESHSECLVVDDDLLPPVVCQTDGGWVVVSPLRALASWSLGQMLSVRKQQVVCGEHLPPNGRWCFYKVFFTAVILRVVGLVPIFFYLISDLVAYWHHFFFRTLVPFQQLIYQNVQDFLEILAMTFGTSGIYSFLLYNFYAIFFLIENEWGPSSKSVKPFNMFTNLYCLLFCFFFSYLC